jgi:Protein of unknown function (DUF2442)
MTTSSVPMAMAAAAQNVRVTDRALVVELRDGRVVSVPLVWYPRLAEGSPRERKRWELLGPGIGIHWPELDEDISVEGLLAGARSGESATSLNAWRASRRNQARKGTNARRGDRLKPTTRPRARSRTTTGN